ncbi:MAG: hypothetical protein AB1765_05765 [Candidatus Hydrogenedentota bacterium]
MTEERVFTGRSHKDAITKVREEFGEEAIILTSRKLKDRYEIIARANKNHFDDKSRIKKSYDIKLLQQKLKEEMERRRKAKDNAEKLKTDISLVSDDEVFLKFSKEPYEEAEEAKPLTYKNILKIRRYTPEKPKVDKNEIGDGVYKEVADDETTTIRKHNLQNEIIKQYNHSYRETNKRIEHFEDILKNLQEKVNEVFNKISIVEGSQKKIHHPVIEKFRIHLVNKGIDKEIIADIVNKVGRELKERKDINDDLIKEMFVKEIRRSFSIGNIKFGSMDNNFELVVLMGPAGCGKTTTLVKMARLLIKEYKMNIGIATMDYQKVGAKEQIGRYARVLDVPVLYVTKPVEMDKNLSIFARDKSVILFDTPGFTPSLGKENIQNMKRYLQFFKNPCKKILILPATWKTEDLKRLIKSYEELKVTSYIFTSIEETVNTGNIFNIMYRSEVNEILWTSGASPTGRIYIPQKDEFINRLIN